MSAKIDLSLQPDKKAEKNIKNNDQKKHTLFCYLTFNVTEHYI